MKKKIFIPIIIAVVAVVLAVIAVIVIYKGTYGKNAPTYASDENAGEVSEEEGNSEALSEEVQNMNEVPGEAENSEALSEEVNSQDASEEVQNLDELSEDDPFLTELEAIEGDYSYEEAKELDGDELFYVDKCYGTWGHLYFKDAESFLTAYGFNDKEPFYEFYADGKLKLTLYYDEETQLGCGVKGDFGVCFLGVQEKEWNGYFWGDYMEPVVVYSGLRPEDYMGNYHYDEIKEYDDAGRLVEYRVTNIADLTAEYTDIENLKDGTVLWNDALVVNYSYNADGTLAYREYNHNLYLFGSNTDTLETWFDEQGRPAYERAYITHGSLEWFYIYEDEDEIPEYILSTDFGWNPAELTQYK